MFRLIASVIVIMCLAGAVYVSHQINDDGQASSGSADSDSSTHAPQPGAGKFNF